MTPTTLMFVVCQALANQGPLDVNGFPVDGYKLDDTTCHNELIQMYDASSVNGETTAPDFSTPIVCSRMAMMETPHWQDLNPGWYVIKVKCPHPDGTFPGDQNT
jgi:hypothetical protein